ncbi:MAG: 16S rRNA (cytosine(967)-C(5))-methyltransferase [Desulfobacteraceae bacterium 4572_19]|nr:MAG: 16S rRNA (cytosine(967)-C(5))-methyltransferase [Desulfobacteraceae bacterium 4572_19]
MKTDSRATALLILNTQEEQKITIDMVMDNVLTKSSPLSRRDKALVTALVYGVLRQRGTLDWIIAHFSKTPLKKIELLILNTLRLGTFQIIFMDKIPDSAAVNTSVQLVKTEKKQRLSGFVNGILRNITRNHNSVPYPSFNEDPVSYLCIKESFPLWLITKWIDRMGVDQTKNLCKNINKIPPITIRVNTLKRTQEEVIHNLKFDIKKVVPTFYSPIGISFYRPGKSIPEIEGFNEGFFQVQDEAAQLITNLLDPQPGEYILDACAGLGGKTAHIAQLMQNKGKIIAMDHDVKKLLQLEKEMKRLGISIVKIAQHDLKKVPNSEKFNLFDRILVDAPCSGLGVLRRNPDSKWSLLKKNLTRYKKRQLNFLNNIAGLLKPSGTLVYAVCSNEPEENEDVMEAFIKNHPNFIIEKKPVGLSPSALKLVDEKGYLKTTPEIGDMDGFFSVNLILKSCHNG